MFETDTLFPLTFNIPEKYFHLFHSVFGKDFFCGYLKKMVRKYFRQNVVYKEKETDMYSKLSLRNKMLPVQLKLFLILFPDGFLKR